MLDVGLFRAGCARGEVLGADALIERGWPGEAIQPHAAQTRLRVAISALRKLGLRELLRMRDEGYRLDPDARTVVEG